MEREHAMTVWIDGKKVSGETRIFNELGAFSPEAMKEARACIEGGYPYRGHTITTEGVEEATVERGARPASWW